MWIYNLDFHESRDGLQNMIESDKPMKWSHVVKTNDGNFKTTELLIKMCLKK